MLYVAPCNMHADKSIQPDSLLSPMQDIATSRMCPNLRDGSLMAAVAEGEGSSASRAAGMVPSLKEITDDLELLSGQARPSVPDGQHLL